ncbi:hypothetical protein ACLJJ6_10345 [Pediococcus siamensis]|uniref:hypothetical protein n=1 Tax=Pediococcus siamensis TaxID=381829 RepID=UPI0039A3525C
MENDYWHQKVAITGLGLLSCSLALASAIKNTRYNHDPKEQQANRNFLLAATCVEVGMAIQHAISIHQDLSGTPHN